MKLLWFAAITACSLSGCVIDADDDDDDYYSESAGPGVLVVEWGISGSQEPDLCFEFDASTISVAVQTASGAFIGDYRQACGMFVTSITLDPGSYVADAVLLDPAGRERTTAVLIDRFSIFGDDELSIPIEFPVNSFY